MKKIKKHSAFTLIAPCDIMLRPPRQTQTKGAITMDNKHEAQVIRAVIKAKSEVRILKDLLLETLDLNATAKEKFTTEFEKRCKISDAINKKTENIKKSTSTSNDPK